jgi:hypothetical protein
MGPFGDDDDDLYDDDLPGELASDDIFRRGLKDEEIDPEFLGKEKLADEDDDSWEEKDIDEDLIEDDLDILTSDLDDDDDDF